MDDDFPAPHSRHTEVRAEDVRRTPNLRILAESDEAGLTHRLWAVTEEGIVEAIRLRFADTKLYIADGHHRYETAINYRNWLREQGVPVGADSDYVMMMLVEMSHPGLVVFPTHRLVRGVVDFDPKKLLEGCKNVTLGSTVTIRSAMTEETPAQLDALAQELR